VVKLAAPPHPANAALVAVIIISLGAVVKEVAHGAKIGGEPNTATIVATCVGHGLSFITRSAHHLFDRMPVHLVRLGVVVAVAAHVRLVATRCNNAASAHVVLAPHFFCRTFISLINRRHGFIVVKVVKVVKVAHDQ
jgi:hypothetical protein